MHSGSERFDKTHLPRRWDCCCVVSKGHGPRSCFLSAVPQPMSWSEKGSRNTCVAVAVAASTVQAPSFQRVLCRTWWTLTKWGHTPERTSWDTRQLQ